jgi:hypothetical protein
VCGENVDKKEVYRDDEKATRLHELSEGLRD